MFDYFKTIFFGEKMPRKKTQTKKEKKTLKESDVMTLANNLLEVYKIKCKNELAEMDLDLNKKRELSSVLDKNEAVVKTAVVNQVALLFKQ